MRAVVVVIFYYDVYVVSSELICGACGGFPFHLHTWSILPCRGMAPLRLSWWWWRVHVKQQLESNPCHRSRPYNQKD